MSPARPGAEHADAVQCRQAINAASVQIVLALEAERIDDDLAFDLREAAEVAEDLADRAPSAGLAKELREIAAKARAKADPDRAESELATRRVDLRAAIAAADVDPPWRCDRLAADGYITILAGRGGEGKSLLARQPGRRLSSTRSASTSADTRSPR